MILIQDFLVDGVIMTLQQFIERFGTSAETQLAYNIVFNALKKIEPKIQDSYEQMLTNDISACPYLFRDIEVGHLNRKKFYNLIMCNEAIPVNTYFCENLHIDRNDSEIWTTVFNSKNRAAEFGTRGR